MRNSIRLFVSLWLMALIVAAVRPLAQTAPASLEVLWQYDTAG